MGSQTTIQTELDLITAIERGEVVSQAALSKRLSVSVGLVNALLRRVVKKGLVKTRSAPYRRWVYYLTPTGFSEKSRLVARYLETSLDFFRKAREEYGKIFLELNRLGLTHAILVGSGELAEVAFLAARENGVAIVGLLDTEMNDNRFLGIPVLRTLEHAEPAAALVVTASRYPQAAFGRLQSTVPDRSIFAPPLLRITFTSEKSTLVHAAEEATA